MTRRGKTNGIIGILILLIIVIGGGVALAATGNLENPLRILSVTGGGGEQFRGREGFAPQQQDGAATSGAGRGERLEGRGGGDSDSIQWSQIGSVLYDVWVIVAVTAVVVIAGPPIGRTIKRLRRRSAPAAAT